VAANPTTVSVGGSVDVSFDYTNATSFTVNFGDGAGTQTFSLSGSGSKTISSQAYQDLGSVVVVVIVSGPGGSDTGTVSINVQ